MLQQRAADRQAARKERAAALGPTVARLCRALERGDVIAIACSEQRGAAIAKAVAALSPARVLWCPPSEALPGEEAPSSPGIAGRRVATLAALHGRDERHVLLVSDAASAAQKVAPPQAFAKEPLIIEPGQQLDGEAFAQALEPLGYFRDDRVDEPGEIAVRGGAIDLFPSDSELPVRVHLDEGRVERIALYDPVNQLGTSEELERLVVKGPSEADESRLRRVRDLLEMLAQEE